MKLNSNMHFLDLFMQLFDHYSENIGDSILFWCKTKP